MEIEKEMLPVADFVRGLFFEDPDLSVFKIEQHMMEEFPKKKALSREVLTYLRGQVKESIGAALGSDSVVTLKVHTVLPMENNMASSASDDMPPTEPNATVERRQEWFAEWANANPMETIDAARSALKSQFGTAFGTTTLSNTMREAKEQARAKNKQKVAAQRADVLQKMNIDEPALLSAARPASAAVAVEAGTSPEVMFARLFKQLGLKRAEVAEDGSLSLDYLPPPPRRIRID